MGFSVLDSSGVIIYVLVVGNILNLTEGIIIKNISDKNFNLINI